jgi:flagellar motility protein MotE (MotC chaperone)
MDGRKTMKWKRMLPLACALLIAFLVCLPARPGFGMSQIRGLVNKIRPGTFPELEAEKEAKPEAAPEERPQERALTENERQILLSLMERKRLLDERETSLNQREEQLRALRDNIQHQIAELRKIQLEIEAGMDAKKALDADNLKKVVSLYDGMDPKKSAQKFQTLDPKVAVQILMAMNQRKAAQLLEELPPQKAKEITEAIVRKAPPPTN